MIPIVVMTKDSILPEGNCYLIGQDGIYLKKDTGLIRALVKVDSITGLRAIKTSAQIDLPAIPEIITQAIISFFLAVFRLYHSEAALLIYFDKIAQEYLVIAPKQKVSYAGVSYVSEFVPKGFNLVGSIHSHADFLAEHSCIDDQDEKHFDGLHIIIGDFHRKDLSISVELVVNGNRFIQEPASWLMGLNVIKPPITARKKPVDPLLSRFLWLTAAESIRYTINNEASATLFPLSWLDAVEFSYRTNNNWRQLAFDFNFDVNDKKNEVKS